MFRRLFLTKSIERLIEQTTDEKHQLKKALGALDVTLIGISAIIGAGIFVLTGVASREHAGPAIIISFVVAGLACAFTAFCYAEFASFIPVSGSAYTYAYASFGELLAWIIGWDLILEYTVGASAVAIGWSGYAVTFLESAGIYLPPWATSAAEAGGLVNIPAILIILSITFLLVLGIKESAIFNNVTVMIMLLVLLFFVIAGGIHFNPENFKDFAPHGWKGIMTGAALIFFAYIGFDAVSTTAEETRNPQKDLPIGILASLGICTILYIIVAAVLNGITNYSRIDMAAPLARALEEVMHWKWVTIVIAIGALCATTNTILALMIGQPRIFFSMSRDRLLPSKISAIHPKYRTPYITTIVTGVTVALAAGFTPIKLVAELCNIGTLFAFILVCGGVLVLRYLKPQIKRPYKAPFFPVVPILGILSCLYLMISLPLITWFRFGAWMALGLGIYFLYGIRKTELANKK